MIDLIHKLSFTEKSKLLLNLNKYTFHVDVRLSKPKIKSLIQELYKVKVVSVNTHRPPQRKRRLGQKEGTKARYKKAIVTLAKGSIINIYQ